MSTLMSIFLGFLSLGAGQAPTNGGEVAQSATRVIEGRVTDGQGRPVREGKVMFAPRDPPLPFQESATASVDAEGHYRIELSTFRIGTSATPATVALQYLVLVPGFRRGSGRIDAASGPIKLDVKLTPEEWRTTEILLVDREGKPVAGASVSLKLGGRTVWSRQSSDAQGRCLVKSAADVPCMFLVEHDAYVPMEFGTRSTAVDPISFKVPLFASIEGRVVDPARKPLAGIQIGMMLAERIVDKAGEGLRLLPLRGSKEPVTTDAHGRFRLAPIVRLDGKDIGRKPDLKIWPPRICFADKDLRQVFFLRVDLQRASGPYEITLRPTRAVRIPIEHTVAVPSGAFLSSYSVNDLAGATGSEPGVVVVSGVSRHGPKGDKSLSAEWIETYLPAGKYRVQVNSVTATAMERVESRTIEVVVPPGDGLLSLPPIRMSVAPLRTLTGEPAPEIDAKDAQTGSPVKLADCRGKVVVLDFWGHWCGPCLAAMPHLIDAHDRYQGKPVVIIALHDQSIQSGIELRSRLSGVKRQLWNNRDLPFTVAFDGADPAVGAGDSVIAKGVTIGRYKIHSFPTTLVIDKEGRVVGRVDASDDAQISAMIDKALQTATK
jgi:thiol-disulfide isomerase/thioredoxin